MISLVILVASLVSGIAGFAFSAICGAMLFHLIDDPVRAVQIMMICSVGGQSLMVWALRREIPWRSLSVFLAGAAIGLPLGIFVLLHTRSALYAQAIGVVLVLYAFFMMASRPMILRRQNALFDAMAGFLGGVTGGAAAFPGAFVTIWCGFKGWPKEKQRALYQPFILIVQLAAIAILALPGFIPQGRPAFDFAGFFYPPSNVARLDHRHGLLQSIERQAVLAGRQPVAGRVGRELPCLTIPVGGHPCALPRPSC